MTVHDAIPERKRLIGQFHLFNVKTPLRRGFCYPEVGTKMNDCPLLNSFLAALQAALVDTVTL
ncbi:hypothetical protein YA21_21360 [Klebsiella aerogenes]|nr:hypothetical protein YA21_21360 [Klebsiella aerogenes]KTJ02802.1 hypothetical protein ASU92_07095 [Klebsiella aerogenes]KTJ37935.1 hypothetical protein ASU85_02750 [Klebsiella aerogenes]KZQ60073.1 hypothetical protein A3N50_16275 [Klebsiella aerogenes]